MRQKGDRDEDDFDLIREKTIKSNEDTREIASSPYEKGNIARACTNETRTSVIRIVLSGIWNAQMECLLLEISSLAVAIAFD